MKKILFIFFIFFSSLYANINTCPTEVTKIVNAQKDGYIDDITINGREFDSLDEEEIVFYPEDLEDGKVVIRGILESNSKDVPVSKLRVAVSVDGGKSWHIAKGNEEWEWSFEPEIGKAYRLSLKVVRVVKKEIPKLDIKPVFITSVKPDRILKNSKTEIIIKGTNFTNNLKFSLESEKIKITSVEFIAKDTIKLKLNVPEKTDVDVSAILFKPPESSEWFKSNAHVWFVGPIKIPKNIKLQCESEKKEEKIVTIALEPQSLEKYVTSIEDTGTSQKIHSGIMRGAIPFLDDQLKLKWSAGYNIEPAYYIVSFYTVDKKRIKSFIIQSNDSRGSLKLTPAQLYELYKHIPANFTPENDENKNPEKYKLGYYVKNYPGARFLFWKVEAFKHIKGCKKIAIVKIGESKFEVLRMGKAPTGTVCDERNKLLSVTKIKGSNSENFYPGDTLELYGKFSLENSPWSPKDLVVDWGDGTYDIIDLHEYDRDSAISCEHIGGENSLSCNITNSGINQIISLKKEHTYTEAGRFKIRVYVLPVEELGKASQIAKRNRQNDEASLLNRFYYYAKAGNVKSDAFEQFKVSSVNKIEKMQTASDRIFEVYCNPLDVYIVKDPDANGPLKLTSLKIDHFSSDEKNEKGLKLKTFNAASLLNKDKTPHTSVTPCSKAFFAVAKLRYHGKGVVRISWFVDGVKVQMQDFELGPTPNRDNLNYNDPKSWSKPIDEILSIMSPKLPVKEIKKHNISVKAEVLKKQTQKMMDYSVMGIYNILENGKNKEKALIANAYYDVKKQNGNKPCVFLYPVKNNKYLMVFDLRNLKKSDNTYSGEGKVLFRLANSYNGVSEYYLSIQFENWEVDKNLVVKKGSLSINNSLPVTTSAGIKLTIKKFSAYLNGKIEIKADYALSDNSLYSAKNNKPVIWKDLSSIVSYDGDIYIKDLSLPITRIGWSLFNISSQKVDIDLSHKEGKGGDLGVADRKWVGINIKEGKLYPYTFNLANELSLPIGHWVINGSGLNGKFNQKEPFSHVLGEGKIGWDAISVEVKGSNLEAKYKNFYIDMPWPKVRLKGGDVTLNYKVSSKKETEVEINLQSSEKPVEKYGALELRIKKIKGFAKVDKEMGMFADATLIFYDRDRKQKIPVDINDMFFSMFETVGFGKNNASFIQISLKNQTINLGGAVLNVEKVLLKSYHKHGSAKKLDADFNAFLTLEKWSQTSTHITYALSKKGSLLADELKVARFKPVTRSYPLSKPMNKSTLKDLNYITRSNSKARYAFYTSPLGPKSDVSLYPHLAGVSVNMTGDECGAMESDTFSAHVNTSYFPGAPAVEGTFRYGTLEGKSYWLIYTKLDNAHIPIFPSVFLYMIKGGACYHFDPDDLVKGSGCNSKPSMSHGLGLAFGAGVMVGDENLLKVQSTLVINKSENKVGFYDIKGTLFKKVDIKQGKMEYVYKSHFQSTIGAQVSFPNNSNPVLTADATGGENGKVDLYLGNTYYLHVGTEDDPLTCKMLMFRGDGYFMAGTDIKGVKAGFHSYYGFSSVGDKSCEKSRANCASIGVDTRVNYQMYYDPFSFLLYANENYHAKACINFGKPLGKHCVGVGALGYFKLGCCNPIIALGGAEIDFPSPFPNVGVDIGLKPAFFKVNIHW
ncbi:IPT/TIG domain-containing protein [Nautilia lithotrophica]